MNDVDLSSGLTFKEIPARYDFGLDSCKSIECKNYMLYNDMWLKDSGMVSITENKWVFIAVPNSV